MNRQQFNERQRERILSSFKKGDGCWEWKYGFTSKGYGQANYDGKHGTAHRIVYQLLVGPIPKGLFLDHLCRNRKCVRPEHLEPVTSRENNLRSTGPAAVNAAKSHCKYGHEFTPENTKSKPSRPNSRICRTCKRAEGRDYQRRQRVLQKALQTRELS